MENCPYKFTYYQKSYKIKICTHGMCGSILILFAVHISCHCGKLWYGNIYVNATAPTPSEHGNCLDILPEMYTNSSAASVQLQHWLSISKFQTPSNKGQCTNGLLDCLLYSHADYFMIHAQNTTSILCSLSPFSYSSNFNSFYQSAYLHTFPH